MNFLIRGFVFFAFTEVSTATDLQVDAPVSFGLSLSDELLDIITISAMVGIVVVPLLAGLIYAKILISRLRDEMKKKPTEENGEVDSTFFPVEASQKMGGFQSRLSDMKTNAVLRLWWKKQHKIHGISLIEADIESQARPFASQSTFKSDMTRITSVSGVPSHAHSKKESKDTTGKHHKHKKKKDNELSP